MNAEAAGNGQRTSTILLAVMALIASSGWAYASLGSNGSKELDSRFREIHAELREHDRDIAISRTRLEYLERERERRGE